LAIATIVIAISNSAAAESPKVAAEALFGEGRRLMADNNPALACPKFVESQRLDPSPSTLLNLGSCYEKLGKTASAWATYKEAASLAHTTDRESLVEIAQRHATSLEPTLTRLVIRVPLPATNLELKRDGVIVGPGEWDVAIPVDPGKHRIEAAAPNKKAWSSSVEITGAARATTISVPALEDAPVVPILAPPPVTTTPAPPLMVQPRRESASPRKTIGLVAGGTGIAGLAVGTVLVVLAKSKYDESRHQCPSDPNLCTPDGVSLRDDARRLGNIATVAYGAGLAALVGGAVLYLTAPRMDATRTGLRVSPTASGILLSGRW